GSGSVTLSGTLQSKAGTAAAAGHVSITISGAEMSTTIDPCYNPDIIPPDGGSGPSCPQTRYDSGTVTITVNGHADSAGYGVGSTPATIASGLAAAINADSAAPVTASASGSVVTLTSKITGTAGNYTFSTTSATNDIADFGGPSFAASPVSGSLTGGTNAGPPVYDHGTCTVSVNGTAYNQGYNQGDTPSTIASGLASTISTGAWAPATASGATISLTAKTGGAASNYQLTSSTTCSYDAGNFSSPSFSTSTSGATLTGGLDGSPAATDAGTVAMSVGGYSATANYGTGQDTTASAVASDLVAKIQAQLPASNPLFTISASGGSININWGNIGTAGNVAVSTTSTTALPGSFAKPSFASCSITANPQNCSTTLSGGTDPTPGSLNTPYVTLYAYDALGNLTCVEQHGDAATGTGCSAPASSDATSPWRGRRFTYDSLSRLLTSSNPESNTAIMVVNGVSTPTRVNTAYTYDADSNLVQKIAPTPNQTGSATQTITYCYDQLHRLTG